MFLIRKNSEGNPLIIWFNPPGLNAELTPTKARELAEQLQMVASCAEEEKDQDCWDAGITAVIHCQGRKSVI